MTRRLDDRFLSHLILLVGFNFTVASCGVFELEVEGTSELHPSTTPNPFASLTKTASGSMDLDTPSATTTPSLTPSPTTTEQPRDYPDELYAPIVGQGLWFEDFLWAVRDGELILNEPAPMAGAAFWDYSATTNRLAYGTISSDITGGTDLWVYDYTTGDSEQWLERKVIQAQWGPIVDPKFGVQLLAALIDDGLLVVMTGPNSIIPLADLSCCLSWSPTGKSIAVARNNRILSFPIDGSWGRAIADEVTLEADLHSRGLVWALAHESMIYPKNPIHIVRLDLSEDFLPTALAGEKPGGRKAATILWSPASRILVFDEIPDPSQTSMGVIWVYRLSSDLHSVMDQYTFAAEDLTLIDWLIPGESVITSYSGAMRVIPSAEEITGDATIRAISSNDRLLYLGGDLLGYRIITLSDQTRILNQDGSLVNADALQIGSRVAVLGHPVFHEALLAENIQIR